ncbi:MAG: hypothetical protein ABW032_06865 [Burkholderiaceae bacterium]
MLDLLNVSEKGKSWPEDGAKSFPVFTQAQQKIPALRPVAPADGPDGASSAAALEDAGNPADPPAALQAREFRSMIDRRLSRAVALLYPHRPRDREIERKFGALAAGAENLRELVEAVEATPSLIDIAYPALRNTALRASIEALRRPKAVAGLDGDGSMLHQRLVDCIGHRCEMVWQTGEKLSRARAAAVLCDLRVLRWVSSRSGAHGPANPRHSTAASEVGAEAAAGGFPRRSPSADGLDPLIGELFSRPMRAAMKINPNLQGVVLLQLFELFQDASAGEKKTIAQAYLRCRGMLRHADLNLSPPYRGPLSAVLGAVMIGHLDGRESGPGDLRVLVEAVRTLAGFLNSAGFADSEKTDPAMAHLRTLASSVLGAWPPGPEGPASE